VRFKIYEKTNDYLEKKERKSDEKISGPSGIRTPTTFRFHGGYDNR
jgi:hypothetical protein